MTPYLFLLVKIYVYRYFWSRLHQISSTVTNFEFDSIIIITTIAWWKNIASVLQFMCSKNTISWRCTVSWLLHAYHPQAFETKTKTKITNTNRKIAWCIAGQLRWGSQRTLTTLNIYQRDDPPQQHTPERTSHDSRNKLESVFHVKIWTWNQGGRTWSHLKLEFYCNSL